MGGGSGSGQSSSTYSPPPEVRDAYKALLARSGPLFSQPFQPYGGDQAAGASNITPYTVAPQTPNQVAAGQNIASLAGYYQPYGNAATDLVQQGSKPIGLQQFNNQAVNQYMSPFMQNVMGTTTANINETNAQQQQQVLGNSISKGAFGGDRSGIAQAELARQQNLANNATLANIANTGYNSALGQFNTMNNQNMQAQGLSRQLAQSGAGLLSNIGSAGQNAAIQQAQAQYGIGAQQQQQNQAELSTAYQNYLNQIGYPFQRANFESGLVGSMASGMGGTTTNNPAQPSGMSQAIGGIGAIASFLPLLLKEGGRVPSHEDRDYAKGGEVVPEGLGVSPIAGMTASSYIPSGSAPMANPHVPQAPGAAQDPNKDMYSNLKDAVKNVRSMMDKRSENADAPEKPPEGAVAPIEAEANFLDYASGGYIPHFDTGGGVAPAATNSFAALKSSQQHYTQTLPNAGVMPAAHGNVSNTDAIGAGAGAAPPDMATARANYTKLAGSGNVSLADLQSAYDLYRNATPSGIGWKAAPSSDPVAEKKPEPTLDSGGGGDGGGGGGGGSDGGMGGVGDGGSSSGSEGGLAATGGRIHAHRYAAGGNIVNYAGMPTSKTVKDQAEEAFGSGQAGGNTTIAALASEDLLPGRAYGGVIHREHHANPDETNGYSNVAGKTAGVAAVAPEEGVATGVPRKNYGNFHPEFASRFEQFVKRANEEGIPIKPGSGFRDANEQAAIYADKQAGNRGSIQHLPVAPPYASGHQYGLASDFSGAKPSQYGRLGEIATETGLNYGGKFGDPIHVQYGPNSFSELRQHAYDESGKFKPGFTLPQDWADRSKEAANAPYPAGLVGAKPSGVVQGAAPQGQGGQRGEAQESEMSERQKAQNASGVNQAAYKDAILGRLGVSMTDNQRLAMFNAFAKMAGTPGKFGVGLAAAADTYSKTLMEANKQQREGYTAESEAKLRGEEAASKRVTNNGLTTTVRSPADKEGNFSFQKEVVVPGSTVQFNNQAQPGATGQNGVGGAGTPSGTENAPQAPLSPQQEKEISLLGPRLAGDKSNPFNTLDKLAQDALKNNSGNETEARAAYMKEFGAAQGAAKLASASHGDIASTVKAVTEIPKGGLTGFGPGSEERTRLARTINLGLQSMGFDGFDENNITNKQILDKVKTLAANEQGGSAAARWLETFADAFPNTNQTGDAAKILTAKLLVNSTRNMDYANVAQLYGGKTYQMGFDVLNAFNKINPQKLYDNAQTDISNLMINNTRENPQTGKLRNPVSALLAGEITPEEFNTFAASRGSKISNLSRFVLGQ
jgi:hypothetical protein